VILVLSLSSLAPQQERGGTPDSFKNIHDILAKNRK
jgi:hypothetical protein